MVVLALLMVQSGVFPVVDGHVGEQEWAGAAPSDEARAEWLAKSGWLANAFLVWPEDCKSRAHAPTDRDPHR